MKKYILLAGVALATMTASNVMADTYSDVNVKANIEVFSHRSCTDLNFGTIKILPSANLSNGAIDPWAKVVLATDGTVTTSGATVDSRGYGIMGVTGAEVANCGTGGTLANSELPTSVTLKNGNSTLTVGEFMHTSHDGGHDYVIGATLTIPDVITVEAGEYTGSFTVYYAN